MMNTDLTHFITAVSGSSIVSSVVTYMFARRKYNTEADTIEIANLKESIKVYKEIIDDVRAEYKDLKEDYKQLKIKIELMEIDFTKQLEKAKHGCKEAN